MIKYSTNICYRTYSCDVLINDNIFKNKVDYANFKCYLNIEHTINFNYVLIN